MSFFQHIPVLVDAYKFVLEFLQPVKMYPYHNIGHTLDVFGRAHALCVSEKISEKEMTHVLLAALFHDTGFVKSYAKNETIGIDIAREWLEKYHYPEEDIRAVERLIYVTIPNTPVNTLLEGIIQDADLDNFGRDDCFAKMYAVEEELRVHSDLTTKEIYDIFLDLHSNITFKSPTAQKERNTKKEENRIQFLEIYKEVVQAHPNYSFETNVQV
jgi:HD superfamily phosphodiesterase